MRADLTYNGAATKVCARMTAAVVKGKLIQGLGGCSTYRDEKCFISAHDAATGKEVWSDKYESAGATGPAQQYSGPRSSPAVAEGKVAGADVAMDVGDDPDLSHRNP